MPQEIKEMVRAARIEHTVEKSKSPRANLPQAIREMMADTDNAQTHRAHTPVGMNEPTAYIPTRAARSLTVTMGTVSMPALFGKDGRLRRVPGAAPAGTIVTMDASVVASSRVAGAGAHFFVMSDNRKAHAVGANGAIALESLPVEFRNVEAALFGTVDIEAEDNAPVIDLPVFGASMEIHKNSVSKGVRFEIPRSERRRVQPDLLADEISIALSLGLARAADEVLLSAIASNALQPFTLARAVSRGLTFDELSALVGTEGTGAVAERGALHVSGINAEMTPDMPGTIVGAFNRAGVIIADDVRIYCERLGTSGHLAVTAWASFLPLVPDASAFWIAA